MLVTIVKSQCLTPYQEAFPELFIQTTLEEYSWDPHDYYFKSIIWWTKTPSSYYQRVPIAILESRYPPNPIAGASPSRSVSINESYPLYCHCTNPNPSYHRNGIDPATTYQRCVSEEELLNEDRFFFAS